LNTYFAAPERADTEELAAKIAIIHNNAVMTGLLHAISGLLAILDEHRQIVAINDSFLKMLGIDNPSEALGLRPGEAVGCRYAHDEPAGCGTTKFCSTCGAAIAIVASLEQDKPVERTCALTLRRGDAEVDMALLVRSQAVGIDQQRFILLFLQDITVDQRRAALERTFFHDINNMLGGLIGASELLALQDRDSELVKVIYQSSLRLKKEVEMQRCLLQDRHGFYQPVRTDILPVQVMDELKLFFAGHPAARKRTLQFSAPEPSRPVQADFSMLLRVLSNMVINALEATDENGEVKVWSEQNGHVQSFCVWNEKAIDEDIALRIFQRNFSTKDQAGRGIGTYSMKLFGEKILGGKVGFTSSREKGTVFKISLPCAIIH
jgi:signal transduction histidine kinase